MKFYYFYLLYNFGKEIIVIMEMVVEQYKRCFCSFLFYLVELKGIRECEFEEYFDNGVSLFKL